ncbi:hypothetical protein Sjap_003430 [Stephania japonica]|uniref:(+)-delta-cadinene synthase n=1 Tax=Stephania japonica TaxID=461633 RepID=A0AAP0PV21_9MAGN
MFRLLRQQGYDVSSDVFNKFKDDKGEFKSTLIDDVKGMLSLYEAAHIRFHGEDVLEEALIFTTTNVSCMMNSSTSFSCSPLGRQIKYSLDQPFHKAIPRLEARRYYISLYESENEKLSDSVTRLAKLDFQLVQALHRQELSDLSRWWKDLDLVSKLPLVRDRLVECYFWATAAYFEPSDSLSRVFLAKLVIFITLVDDIFDVYATFEELKLFMGAFERWDASSVNELPEYMKVCYQAILDEFEKLEEVMDKEGCSYHVHYCKEAMKELVRAYFVEAKWYSEGHTPKLEEYLSNGSKSAGYCLSLIASFVGKGKMITKEAFEWMRGAPKPLRSLGLITRLLNDVASHQIEQQRGDVASAVECYMKEYGASEQEACDEIKKMIEEAWKDVNEECFMTRQSRVLPWPLPLRIVSLSRTPNLIYKYDEDTYSHSTRRLKENVTLLYNP